MPTTPPQPDVISPNPPSNKGMDYAALREQAVALVQGLSGDTWTDYNESDPGVTLLEQMCYALTALSYRAELPLTTLLSDAAGRIRSRRQALYTPRSILPCNPVTAEDLRSLVIDRIPIVRNAWFVRSATEPAGLYDALLYVPADINPRTAATLQQKTSRLYAGHRSLCEDLNSVQILSAQKLTLTAEITLHDNASPEVVLATVLFQAGLAAAPEPQRQSLATLLGSGLSPATIFNGPLLRNGFYAAGQLRPLPADLAVSSLVPAQLDGVVAVRAVRASTAGRTYSLQEDIPIQAGTYLRLDTQPSERGIYPVQLLRGGVRVKPNPAAVQRELDKLWQAHRREYPLDLEYSAFLPMPEGEPRDVERYTSIQNGFPAVYGIGEAGLPSEATVVRRAQAHQLKGYLMVFDQLMADFMAQLAHTRDLFSTAKDQHETYWFQDLATSVPDAAPLLQPNYLPGLKDIVGSEDDFISRRGRMLDFLLAMYAESLDAGTVPRGSSPQDAQRSVEAKLQLLRRLQRVTADRGRAFDKMRRPSPGNTAGMLVKCRADLHAQMGNDAPDIYLIEHILLRPPQPGPEDFAYSFTLTAVIIGQSMEESAKRTQVMAVLDSNMPAHLVLVPCFLDWLDLAYFDGLYAEWCAALHGSDVSVRLEINATLRRLVLRAQNQDGVGTL